MIECAWTLFDLRGMCVCSFFLRHTTPIPSACRNSHTCIYDCWTRSAHGSCSPQGVGPSGHVRRMCYVFRIFSFAAVPLKAKQFLQQARRFSVKTDDASRYRNSDFQIFFSNAMGVFCKLNDYLEPWNS